MFAGDHTERERIDHGNRAQTRSAMHAARDFAAGVEALDRGMGRGGDHLRIRVDHDAAHRVMDLRSDFNAVVRTLGQVEAVLELQDTVEFRVFLLGDEAVEAFNLFEERSLIDLEVVGKFFERIELLDRAHFDRQLHEGRINSLDDLFAGNGDRIIFILADDVEERVGLDLAASVFIHEALAGLAVNNDAEVHAGVVGEVHGNAKALFTRIGVGEELQPAELDRSSTDAERLDEHTGRGAELVRGVRGRNNARVLNLTEPNVAGETAGGKHDAELGADSLGLAGLVFEVIALELGVEAIAFAVGDAHNSIAVHDEVVELGAGLHRDVAELLDLVVHRVDVARAGAGLNFIGTRNGVAAFEEHVVGHEFGAAVLDKLDRVVAAVNDLREQFNVVEAETVFQAVSDEEFTAVLDALSLLHGVDRAGNVAAADGGVAADDRHFFEHQNLFAGAASLEGAGHTGKAGADDDDIVFFVILLNLGSGNAKASTEPLKPTDWTAVVRRAELIVERHDARRVPIYTAPGQYLAADPEDDRPAWVLGDALELELLVLNFIRNAAHAAQKNPKGFVSVSLAREGDNYVLHVTDNGPKLSPEGFARLTGYGDSVKQEGMGIGLSICRGIADRHGGQLKFYQLPTEGVCAEAVIEAAEPPEGTHETDKGSSQSSSAAAEKGKGGVQ